MLQQRAVLGIGIAGLVVASAAGLCAGCADAPRQLQRLPDGGTVRLLGVTHPGAPVVTAGPPLFSLLAPLLPVEQRERMGLLELGLPGNADPLTVWLKHRPVDPADPMDGPFDRIVAANMAVTVTDDTGAEYCHEGRFVNFDRYSSLYSLTLPVVPRRGRELTLHLFDIADDQRPKPLARFTVGNPLQRSYPTWTPSSLPVRAESGALGVTLKELTTGLAPRRYGSEFQRSGSAKAVFGQQQWSRASFSMTWQGKPTSDWQPGEVWIADASGNAWKPSQLESPPNTTSGTLRFAGNLWNEEAWKLRFRFRQTSGFAASDVLRAPIVIPAKGRAYPSHRRFEVGGAKVEILAVLAAQEPWKISGGGASYESSPSVMVRVAAPDEGRLRLLKVGELDAAEAGAWDGGEIEKGIWRFVLPPGTRPGPIALTFALQRARDVTFLAKAIPASPASVRVAGRLSRNRLNLD